MCICVHIVSGFKEELHAQRKCKTLRFLRLITQTLIWIYWKNHLLLELKQGDM